MKNMKIRFKRFNELKEEDINFDFHIHTNQTDGLSTPEEIVAEAISLKLKAIAFTEHVRKNSGWFDDFKKRIDNLRNNNNIRIFFGIEAKAIDFNGTLDATLKMIGKSDIVLGVVHRYPDGKGGQIALNETKNLGLDKASETEFKLALGLLTNKDIDVLGHPFGVYSKFFNKFPEDYMKDLLIESLKKDKAVEINTKYIFEKDRFFKLFKEINPYVSLGSDAHSKEEIAKSFDLIREVVKK